MKLSFFKRNEGSVFAVVALTAMAVVGTVGVAVDVGRSQMVKSKLQAAVDSAGLAAGASMNTQNISTTVQKYINLNFTQSTMGAHLDSVTTTLSPNKQLITVTTKATVPTTFMKIFGKPSIQLTATSQITRTTKGMELALVLDTTGSMSGTKLTSLKSSANMLLDILYGTNQTLPDLFVGVVPFTQAVNVGPSHTNWLTPTYSTLDWGTTTWKGCVDARWKSPYRDLTDDPPSVEKFEAYYWYDHSRTNDWITTNSKGKNVYTINSNSGPNRDCPSQISTLSNVKANAVSGVNALVAGGNTIVSEGAAWGWRLLSPRWRGLWGGTMDSNNLPLDYGTPLMQKVAVIMTDGANTIDNNSEGAYGYLGSNQLGANPLTLANGTAKLDGKLAAVCTKMKAQGIIVYTILFQVNTQSVIDLMQNCATSPSYFFNSPDAATLQTAFQQIGDSLSNLRISQ